MSSADCRTCGSTRVVPVLDKRIERKPTGGGNKYRRYCRTCDSWQPCTSAETFESHPNPHVLPVDGEPDDPDTIVPLTDYDYGPEWEELADRVAHGQNGSDLNGSTPENEFSCPVCGTRQTGFPSGCISCDAVYRW